MNLLRHWKTLLAFLLVFSAGAVTGTVWTHLQFKHAFERSLKLESWSTDVMDILQKKLSLTPEQRPGIRAIVEDMGRQLKATFSGAIKESSSIFAECGRRLDQELSPEQRAVHQRMRQEFRDGLKKHLDIDLPPE